MGVTQTSMFYEVDDIGNNDFMIQLDILCLFMFQLRILLLIRTSQSPMQKHIRNAKKEAVVVYFSRKEKKKGKT